MDWAQIEKILSSRAVETGLGVTGAALQAKGQGDREKAALSNNAAQFRARLLSDFLSEQQQGRDRRAVSASAASPLGAEENFAHRNAVLRSILPGLQNYSVKPGDPAVAAAMGSSTGGFRLPPGGLPPEALAHISPEATAGAIARRGGMVSNIDPTAPTADFSAMGFEPNIGQRYTDSTKQFATNRLAATQADDNRVQEMVMRALEEDYLGEKAAAEKKKSGGFWKKFGKIASVVAPIVAAPFTGGASLMLLGAGAGALGGAIDGGWKGAVTGGAMGALPGIVGQIGRSAASTPPLVPNQFSAATSRRGQPGFTFGGR